MLTDGSPSHTKKNPVQFYKMCFYISYKQIVIILHLLNLHTEDRRGKIAYSSNMTGCW